MDKGEKEISLSKNAKCIREVATGYRQIIIGNIFAIGNYIWQVWDVSIVYGLVLRTENVLELIKVEQNVGNIIIWEWVDMDKLQWRDGGVVGGVE